MFRVLRIHYFEPITKMDVNVLADFFDLLFIIIALKLHCNIDALLVSFFERISASKVCNKEMPKIKVTLMFDD